jgi:hypothetical protein
MSTSIEELAQPRATVAISQTTAVEQARAVAEVAAALRGAQDMPRAEARARAQMLRACGTMALAQKAFYSVPNRGSGPSVHLARELARCFGNIQHGMVELKRDDRGGESEMQAFAWDVENNTRSVRSFINPHVRMKGKQRQALTDTNDIINNNNNAGARAVRETIFTVLPVWFVEEAKTACQATLERGDGESIPERIAKAIDAFSRYEVSADMLEGRLRRGQDRWDAQDVADLTVLFQSLRSGETTVADEFPATAAPAATNQVTAADITGQPSAQPDDPALVEDAFPPAEDGAR